jgi:hypothetical protein
MGVKVSGRSDLPDLTSSTELLQVLFEGTSKSKKAV